jgi:hypothetical protein
VVVWNYVRVHKLAWLEGNDTIVRMVVKFYLCAEVSRTIPICLRVNPVTPIRPLIHVLFVVSDDRVDHVHSECGALCER